MPSEKMHSHKNVNDMEFHQGKTFFLSNGLGLSNCYTSDYRKTANSGSILISVRAPVGSLTWCDRSVAIGRGLCAVKAGKDIDANYMFWFLASSKAFLLKHSTGSTFQAIGVDTVKSLVVPMRSLEDQKRIGSTINKMNSTLLVLTER